MISALSKTAIPILVNLIQVLLCLGKSEERKKKRKALEKGKTYIIHTPPLKHHTCVSFETKRACYEREINKTKCEQREVEKPKEKKNHKFIS